MKIKKTIICFLSITAAITLFLTNENTIKHESDQIISMKSNYAISNEIIDFNTPTIVLEDTPVETNIIIEKTADISQKYTEIDFNLNTNRKTHIYENDSTESIILDTVDYYTNIYCIGEDVYNDNGFYKVNYNNTIGYVQKILLTDEIMFDFVDKNIVITEPTILYEDPTKENIIVTLEKGVYPIDIENNEWIRINYNNSNGYINKQETNSEILQKTENIRYLISESDVYDLNMNITSAKKLKSTILYSSNNYSIIENQEYIYIVNNNNLTDEIPKSEGIIDFAYSMLGVKYSYGSASQKATDCSGLTLQCYKSQGITIPRTASEQYKSGTKISYENIQPGDLIAWSKNSSTVTHIGIYIGNDEFIHASSGKGKVIISNISEYKKHSTYIGAVRY